MPYLRIAAWDAHRGPNKRSVTVPLKWDGLSYARVLGDDPSGGTYAAWVLLIQAAKRSPSPGYLLDSRGDQPTPEDLQAMTKLPADVFRRAIPILVEVGWLEEVDEVTPLEHKKGGRVVSEWAVRVARRLFVRVREHYPRMREPNFKSWGEPIQQLLDEGNTPDEIVAVLQWLFKVADLDAKFWVTVIRSPAALHKNWGALHGKFKKNQPKESTKEYRIV